MDRLYIIDEEAIGAFGADSAIIRYVCAHYTKHKCDKYMSFDNITELKKTMKFNNIEYKVIPITSVEHMREFLLREYNTSMTPIEIPDVLQYFSPGYEMMYGKELLKNQLASDTFFIKRIDRLKSWNNLLYDGDCSYLIDKNALYSICPRQQILAEYRVFIYKSKIMACQLYSGDPLVFPNSKKIQEMINVYKNISPKAYTLDIAVTDTNTIPIEVHPFVSCGLYGFEAEELLDMWEAGLDWYISQNKLIRGQRAKLPVYDDACEDEKLFIKY